MRGAAVLVALIAALALQTIVTRFAFAAPVDLVLVVVVATALAMGPVGGLLAGTLGGIAQDTLAGGIIGVSGLVQSTVGYFAGVAGRQFIVTQPVQRFVVFFAASAAQAGFLAGLYRVVREPVSLSLTGVATQAAVNAVIGVAAFEMAAWVPAVRQRRRRERVRQWRRRLEG